MKRLSLLLATLAWLVTGHVTSASAWWVEGHQLVEWCRSDDAGQKVLCIGYVLGVADVLDTFSTVGALGLTPVCIDQTGVSPGQLERIVMKYLDTHPEETHRPAMNLVTIALHDVFPC